MSVCENLKLNLNVPHTKSMLKLVLSQRDIHLKKRWGQNFLIDQNLLQYIIRSSDITSEDIILEIGAGTGSLTRMLAEKAKHVFAVEIDRMLYDILTETMESFNNVSLMNIDFLKSKHHINPELVEQVLDYIKSTCGTTKNKGIKVISNLPYYISTPVIIDLLQGAIPVDFMILTLQSDVTHRLVAGPGTKDYGLLSIMAKLYSDVKILKKLPPDVFWPAPMVNSTIVRMKTSQNKYFDRITNFDGFQDITKAIYTSRRKTLLNNLLSLCSQATPKKDGQKIRDELTQVLKGIGISPESRGEELDLEKLIELSNEIYKHNTA